MSFLFKGSIASLVNLSVLGALMAFPRWTYLPAALVAMEGGLLCGFILNDRFIPTTFVGSVGGGFGRYLRYHGVCALGQALAIVLALVLIHLFSLPPLIAQAVSIAAFAVFNFAVIRVLTITIRS